MSGSKQWQGKKVLITGAGGFIGSHLTEKLVSEGAKVRAMVRYNSRGSTGWLTEAAPAVRKELEIVQGDLRDADTVSRYVQDREVVFHLGAMISIPYSYISPSEASAVNVGGTLNVLNACRSAGVERVVHTSTSEVYGTAQYVPIDEKHPLVGQSPYSASKIGADNLVESFFRSFDLPVVTVRPFNTFGPRQSARAVIPSTILQFIGGKEVRLGNLTPTRDFTFVSDTVEGMLAAGSSSDKALGRTVNLGSKQEISIKELVTLISELMGNQKQIKIEIEQKRLRPEKSEVNRLFSDNALAGELIGWSPQVSLREGLISTIEWLRKNSDQYLRGMTDYVV